jgi:hypothetical protein
MPSRISLWQFGHFIADPPERMKKRKGRKSKPGGEKLNDSTQKYLRIRK